MRYLVGEVADAVCILIREKKDAAVYVDVNCIRDC